MTEAETTARAETEKSIQAIREIDELIEAPSFRAYVARVEARAAVIAETVLEGDIPAEERERFRLQRIGLLSGLRMIANDREGHANILRGHGVEV
jgi:hypothetical protein